MNISLPEVGSWFRVPDGTTFEVVAADADDQTIEVQHFDGTIEEFDFDAWQELLLEPIDPPEDWSGSLDVDEEDLPEDEEPRQQWDNPMDFVDDYEDE